MSFIKDHLYLTKQNVKWFLLLAFGYGVFYWANNLLTASLYLETGAHIIHLPSGVCMVIVLVAGLLGALALMVATFPYSYLMMFNENLPLALTGSIATGLIPLSSIYLLNKIKPFDRNLSSITLRTLLILSIVYAVINTSTQQLIIFIFDESKNPLNALLVMFTGDILGILIVLYSIRIIAKIIKSSR